MDPGLIAIFFLSFLSAGPHCPDWNPPPPKEDAIERFQYLAFKLT